MLKRQLTIELNWVSGEGSALSGCCEEEEEGEGQGMFIVLLRVTTSSVFCILHVLDAMNHCYTVESSVALNSEVDERADFVSIQQMSWLVIHYIHPFDDL